MSDDLKAYFREAVSWDIDRTAQTIRRTRIAWIMAGAGWACAVAASVALALMMPLKTVEPYVIRVDNSTGIVDIVPMYAGRAEIGETVARFLLTHYVTVCEGFSYATAERDYEECGAYHTAKRNHRVVQPLEPDQSRLALEPQQGRLGRPRASHGGDLLPQGQRVIRIGPSSLLERPTTAGRDRTNYALGRDDRIRLGDAVAGSKVPSMEPARVARH